MTDNSPLSIADMQNDIERQIAPEYRDQFLDILCRHLDVGVAIMDENLVYQFMSDEAYRQLNITPSELGVGDHLSRCHELMFENGMLTQEIVEKNKLSSEDQAKAETSEGMIKRRLVQLGDGTTHHHVRKNLPGNFTISISEDVSDLVEKEQILERSLAIGNAGYWTYSFKTKKYQFSRSLKVYFGKEKINQIRKHGILSIVEDADKETFKEQMTNLVKNGGKFDVIGRSRTHKGNLRWHQTTAELICDPSGRPLQIWAFVKDNTRYKRQEMALEKAKDNAIAASKAKSEFLANMSHEIRTPMNGILGMAELLANTDINPRQKEFVNVINNSASALLTIINDILDFSKIEAGALELDPVPFDLKDAISDVTSLLVANAQNKGLELIIDYAPNLPRHFIGDGGRIRQVLTNLVGNAIKFTSEGHVAIRAKISDPRDGHCIIKLSVEDTGIGIPEDKLEHIFDKFTQADGSTTRVYGGTGLGLAITKSITEMMGGRVGITSEFGQGSVFSVQIPLPINTEVKQKPLNTASLAGKRALIIDDIKINRQIFSEQLASWGIESVSAEDGVEALKKLKQSQASGQTFDFVMLDYLMPGVNGIEWAQMVSQNDTVNVPPIIMVSSCDPTVSTSDLNDLGIFGHQIKPVRESRLHQSLVELVSLSEQQLLDTTSVKQSVELLPSSRGRRDTFDIELAFREDNETVKTQETNNTVQDTSDSAEDATLENLLNVDAVQDEAKQEGEPTSQTTDDQDSAQTPARTGPRTLDNGKTEILFAEDFPLNQDVVRLMLADSPYQPLFVNNGKEAVDIYEADPDRFPVIVMDVSMPVMDGYEASRTIKKYQADNKLHHTPIIALTGHALKNDRQACLDAGMDDFLTKPVKQTELFDRIGYHLSAVQGGTKAMSA
jgi:signal transduction histidine kinase/DNA-binding response OmpR family regulator